MDPLSDVLSLLKPKSYMFRGLEVGGNWSLQFPATEGIRCYALVSGQCWLVVDGLSDAIHLTQGDCFLLTQKKSFRLASDRSVTPCDAAQLVSTAREGGVLIYNGGGEVTGTGGFFEFGGQHAGILLGLLPPVVHVRDESSKAALLASMELMMQELRDPAPGGPLVAQHLAQMMLVFALRTYMSESSKIGVGWLFALADKQMGAVLNSIHGAPGKAWSLQSLADRACMSRSTFALRFKETVGVSPMEYLLRWRMMLAGDRLISTSDPISIIGRSLGYDSEASFSTAFKRVMGCSPSHYVGLAGLTPRTQQRSPDRRE